MADVHPLIKINIHFLQQGVRLLQDISDEAYQFNQSAYFSSSAGKHMRHVLDHYQSLLAGWNSRIDYDHRDRNQRLETDRSYAIECFQQCIDKLKEMPAEPATINATVRVRSNDSGTTEKDSWSSSSVNRELQFLIGHTVHHYALVAFILRVQDFAPPENFGVAPSTLTYEQQAAEKS